jgi:hypothetical protein
MAILPQSNPGVFDAIKNALGLFSDQNKAQSSDTFNQNPEPRDEYESSMSETEIMALVKQWKSDYSVYYTDIEKGQKLSFDYWVGKHRETETLSAQGSTKEHENASTDNLIFESIETFLPVATRANPEPLVNADPTDIGQQIAHDIKVALVHEADVQILRRKLAKATRGWLLNRIGVIKVCWNVETKRIQTDVINAKRMLFDRDGYIDEAGIFRGVFVGEKKKIQASDLIELFPKKRAEITLKVSGKLGTKLEYIEWWYCHTDVFFTLDDLLLGKYKNPNWNYDIEANQETEQEETKATNHLEEPTNPYRFLCIFNTQEQPHDNTSLILQNIPQQDKINRREKQIDRNVEGMNNGLIVSGDFYTEEQAAQAASALRRGVAIRQPRGKPQDGTMFPQRPGLPADVFQSLQDARQELRNIFGTAGSTAEGVKSQDTVRGKILVNQQDSSRIGGGITEYIEQLADSIYNLWVQFMYVYYDEPHFIVSAGAQAGMELITLKNSNFPLLKTLTITVKEGSLVPKDPLTQRNEAIDLWSANAIDPLNLYKKLDFPNPSEAANQLILWQMLQKGQIQPQMYLPTFSLGAQPGQPGMQQGQPQQPGTGGPPVSAVGSSQPGGIAPQPQAQTDAVDNQSKQLMQSQPLP